MSAFAGVSNDIIDRLLTFTAGHVLGVQSSAERRSERGGEWDSRRSTDRATLRRLIGAGLISARDGVAPDVLAEMIAARGGPELDGDGAAEWFISEAVAGLDDRAARRRGELADGWDLRPTEDDDDEVLEPVVPAAVLDGSVPGWVSAWLGRTLCPQHAAYITALAGWRFLGLTAPVAPSTGWAVKVLAKFERRAGVR